MYFDNITNKELNQMPKPYVNNFSIKLTDILHKTNGAFDNKLFKIEEIITGKLYRIYPLFNTIQILSTNPNDNIFENRLIVCTKMDTETYVTFITDETGEIQDYSNYASLYAIGDSLTTNQYNGIVQLIRANSSISENINISTEAVITDYANYDFSFDDRVILDNGIEITSLTSLKCRLTNPVLHYSNYTLNLKVLRITNTNSEDGDTTNNKVIIPVSVLLEENEWVNIPITNLQTGDVVLYDCNVRITHDKPVIPDWVNKIVLTAKPDIIQTGDTSVLTAECLDIGGLPVGAGHTVNFYEYYDGLLKLTASKPVIQTGDTDTLNITLTDIADGSIVSLKGATVRLYEVFTPVIDLSASKNPIQTGDTTSLIIKAKDSDDGSLISLNGATIRIYEEYFVSSVGLSVNPSILQTGDTSVLTATVKDSDGSLVKDETVRFYGNVAKVTMFEGTETFTRVGDGTGTLNITYSNDKELVYTASSGIYFHSDLMFQSNNDWECSFDFKATGDDGGRIGLYTARSTNAEKELIAIKPQNNWVSLNTQTGNGSMTSGNIVRGYSNYQTLKIVTSGSTANIYLDTVLMKTVSLDWLNEELCFGLHGWTAGNVVYVKNFSFKEVI